MIGGALVPLGVYYAVRSHVGGDAHALMIAGVPAAVWVVFHWVRRRQLDPIGAIVLLGLIAGIVASVLLGGNTFVLKIRDTVFTALLGVVFLVSLTWRRPAIFYVARNLSAGNDEQKLAAYDDLWELPTVPRVFRILTVLWGVGLGLEAAGRITLAASLRTGPFLAVAPVWTAVVLGSLFAFTVWYSRRARQLGEGTGVIYPSVET